MFIKKVIPFFFILISFVNAQNVVSFGSKLGGGTIKGNSPNQSSYFVSFFVDFPAPFSDKIMSRFGFVYAQDFAKILPDNSNAYHSFVKGFSLGAVIDQNLDNNFYMEESIGLLALNDRIFSNTSIWNYGVTFSFLAGLDLRKKTLTGIKIGLGVENGFTFSNTLTKYLAAYLHLQFYL